jgi:hypothetical protein
MPYSVQFVGLVCFYREKGGRQVLLPDGRNPGEGIDPHFASIVVAPEAVVSSTGWNGDDRKAGTFSLPPSMLTLESVDQPGTLDVSKHDKLLPELRRINPNFKIDPKRADAIVRLHIRRGTLTVYTVRAGGALISQLDVPHDGPIHITVTPRDGSSERTIVLRPGTEIALSNTSAAGFPAHASDDEEKSHFRIYERLSSPPVSLVTTLTAPKGVPESPSRHVLFRALFEHAKPINLTVNCSNTGCC